VAFGVPIGRSLSDNSLKQDFSPLPSLWSHVVCLPINRGRWIVDSTDVSTSTEWGQFQHSNPVRPMEGQSFIHYILQKMI